MARDTYDVREEYTGTGSLDTYSFDFKIEALTQLLVVEYDTDGVETQRVRGTDSTYLDSVEFDAVEGGGTVVLAADLTSGYKLILLLANDAPTQASEFKNKADFTLNRIEAALDFLGGAIQRLAYLGGRSVKLNDYDDTDDFDPSLPPGVAGAEALIPATNADGTGWADVADWTPVTDLAAAVAAAAAAAVSQAAAAVSQTAAAASAAAALVSRTAAAASETAAAVSQTAAASSAAAAETSRLEAVLAENSSEAAAAASLASQTAAAASAAAASTSQTAAANSATAAASSAAAASTSQTAAANSATAAASSATAAASSAAAAAASEAAAAAAVNNAIPDIVGTRASPQAIVAGTGLAFADTSYFSIWFIQGSGGAVDVSANPQIAAGTVLGQKLTVIGRSATNTVTLEDGTGLSLNGMWVGGLDDVIGLMWDGTNWAEEYRR